MPTPESALADPKWRFLESVFLTDALRDSLTTRGGRRVYSETATNPQREALRNELRVRLIEIAVACSAASAEEAHIQGISKLVALLGERAPIGCLNEGCLSFGVGQKMVNSYLKYLWCAGRIPTPPHCPFDDIIIRKLSLPPGCGPKWTEAGESDYRLWVNAAKRLAGPRSLAAWELEVWSAE